MEFQDQSEEVKRFRVVAALIRKKGEVLLTQRWPSKHLGLIWEFPGGKVEEGESDQEALIRELKEELGVDVKIGSCCFETCHGYGSREVHLMIYRCTIEEGEPSPIDVKAIEWVAQEKLAEREFPPADLVFVQELVAGRISENDDEDDEDEIEIKPAQVIRRIDLSTRK